MVADYLLNLIYHFWLLLSAILDRARAYLILLFVFEEVIMLPLLFTFDQETTAMIDSLSIYQVPLVQWIQIKGSVLRRARLCLLLDTSPTRLASVSWLHCSLAKFWKFNKGFLFRNCKVFESGISLSILNRIKSTKFCCLAWQWLNDCLHFGLMRRLLKAELKIARTSNRKVRLGLKLQLVVHHSTSFVKRNQSL